MLNLIQVLLPLLVPVEPPALARYEFAETHMGMPFRLTLYAADEATANAAAAAAFRRIAELDQCFSDYHPQSELSRLSATAGSGQAVPVSQPLWDVLSRSQALSRQSGGAFDVTVGPLVRLWRRARRMKELPDEERLTAARQAMGYQHMQLIPEGRKVELKRPGMRLDLGGIAVGYALDEAFKALKRHGVSRALLDGSGDLLAGDPPPGRDGWRIGIAPLEAPNGPPSRYLNLVHAAVTTSGDAFQYVEIAGRRYSHIVDPRTGLGLTSRSSVSVAARDGITADSLATAVSVLGPEAGLKLIESTPGAAALFVRSVDGELDVRESRRLRSFLETKTPQPERR
jgi:thiamine biosynthesis lipoprotein